MDTRIEGLEAHALRKGETYILRAPAYISYEQIAQLSKSLVGLEVKLIIIPHDFEFLDPQQRAAIVAERQLATENEDEDAN